MRADKPVGTLLLYWPSTWSIALCSSPGSLPNIELLTLFGLGAFFMRGAGCVVNDLWDKEFDKKVARTKDRPLANGELSVLQAFTLLGGLLSCSLAILLQLNYYSGISWTLVYDTIYAHQDKADDSIIGLKSTALKFGDNTKPYLSLFGSSMITSLAITGLMTDQTWPYYVGLLLTSCHIGWQIGTLDINNPADCWKKFSTNRYLGLILFMSIVASN
ncbi:putative 4-hydroxybenzoate polyprenyl transferase, partial [Trichinella nativa]